MADSDGQVVIDLSLRKDGIQSDIEWLKSNLRNLGADVNADQISDKFENAMNKTKQTVDRTVESINDKKAKPKISADDSGLKEKAEESTEKIEKLNGKHAKAKISADNTNLDEKVSESREELDKIPKNKKTTITVDDEASEPTKKIGGSFKESTEKSKGFIESLKGTAVGMGIYNAAMKVGSTVSNQFAGAISRYDTLNNYPKILQSMGASANDATASMKTLKDGVDGLPTSLDSVAKAAQRFLPMSKNADDAAKSALALNDAFLASGASSEDASRGLEQYTQMLSSGKVDLMSWRTLEETMPASLKKVAESFGIASGNVQELYKKVQSGEITMKQLNQRFQELDKGTNGFHQAALNATGGIGTAFANLANRIKAAIANAMEGLDQFVKKITGNTIAENINKMSSHFGDFGTKVGQSMSKAGDALKPFSAALGLIGTTVGILFSNVKAQMSGFTSAFKANFISPSKDAKEQIQSLKNVIIKFGESVKPVVSQVGSLMGILSANAFRLVGDAIKAIVGSFTNLGTAIKGTDLQAFHKTLTDIGIGFNQAVVAVEPFIVSLGEIIGIMANGAFRAFTIILHGVASAISIVASQFAKLDGSGNSAKKLGHSLDAISANKGKLEALGKVIGTVGTAILAMKATTGTITKISKGISDLGSKYKAMSKAFMGKKFVSTFISSLKNGEGAVNSFKKAFQGLNAVTKANIFGAIIAAIATLTIAFIELYRHNAKFRKFVNGIVSDVKSFAKKFVKGFKDAFDNVGKFFKGQTKWQKDFGKFVSEIVKDAQSMVKGVTQSKPAKAFQDIGKSISDLLKGNITFKQFCSKITSDFGTLGKFFAKTSPFGLITKAIGNLVKDTKFGRWCTSTVNQVKKMGTDIGKNVKSMSSDVTKRFNDMMNQAGKKVSTGWKNMTHDISNGVKAVVDSHSKLHNQVISKVKDTMGVSDTTFKNGYKTIQDYTKTWHDLVSGNWSDLSGDLKKVTNDLVSTAKSLFKDMYNRLDDMTNGKLTDIRNTWHKIWDDITEKVGSCVRSIGNHAVDIVNNVIKPINDMISKVTDGVNWVIDKFGGDKIKAPTIPELSHFATGGTVGSGGTFAMVNDSGDDDYREMFATPDGKIGAFPEQRDFMTFLPEGTQVLDGKNSRMLADMMGIPAFKDGTKDKNLFEKIFDKAHDIFEDITDILAHPLEFLEKIFTNKIGKLSAKAVFPEELIKHAPSAFAKWGINWVKKLAQDFKEKQESSVGGFGKIPEVVDGQNLRDLVKKALEANGLSTSDDMIARVMRQIATESGGNAHAVQPGADPDGDGSGPALGLMQTKRSTFNAYKAPGHDDIFNAYDNLLAALNYAKHRYGPSLSFLGNGHGYDNGGIVDGKQLAWLAEHNREFVINPQRASADELLRKAAEERAAYDPNSEIAKAISGMNMARQSNGSMIPNVTQISNAYTSSSPVASSSVQDNRPVNISINLDGRTIANVSYPYQKMLQASDIRIQARKGGGAFA